MCRSWFQALRNGLVLALALAAASAHCAPSRLLLTQVAAAPTAAEYIAVFNPNDFAVDLADYYLSDAGSQYFRITISQALPDSGDFIVRFPSGATIAPKTTLIVALDTAANFSSTFGFSPDFQIPAAPGATSMTVPFAGAVNGAPALANAGEMAILFYWDGASDLVTDVDYVAYGTPTAANVVANKTGLMINGSTYLSDTPDSPALHAPLPASGILATCREDFAETGQVSSGGNGVGGTDQTSEPSATTWSTCPLPVAPDRIFIDAFGG